MNALRGIEASSLWERVNSVERSAGVFEFIELKKLLEAEVGYTTKN